MLQAVKSHPLRVRGLKQEVLDVTWNTIASHPLRVRGLKPLLGLNVSIAMEVAPPAGAWIETLCGYLGGGEMPSHPLRVRGLKHAQASQARWLCGRTPCGCVD